MDDRISTLPEHVKHRIFSFLPSIKEVVRTSVLSKLWLQTWRTFQICDFKFLVGPDVAVSDCMATSRGHGETGSFIRFVDDALSRCRDRMPRFRLFATVQMAPHFDRWLGMALDNHVEEIILDVCSNGAPLDTLRYSIFERVFSADFIKSLSFYGGVKIDGISTVNLPSLRSLSLSGSCVDDRMFQRLLGGCPLLESLCLLSCTLLSEIEISNLNYLRRVVIAGSSPTTNVIRIKAPRLETFYFACRFPHEKNLTLEVDESSSLRSLEFKGDSVTDDWFCRFLHKFPLLESLTLTRCSSWRRLCISNPLLKEITIVGCKNLVDIRVETPALSSFYYELYCGSHSPTLPSMEMKNLPNSCAAGFSFYFSGDPSLLWFEELRKFLSGCRCRESIVHLYEPGSLFDTLVPEKQDLIAPWKQHLSVEYNSVSESSYPVILDGLFSTCRPTTVFLRGTYPLLKFISVALANREENPDCCSADAKCWKHELKDVKIVRIGGTDYRGPLDWSSFVDLLHTLSTSNEVCLRLLW